MKEITGYEGLYAITSCGKVWSCKSKKFLKGNDTGLGYLQVRLYKDGGWRSYYVHSLVAQEYLPNPNNYSEVNHKDEIKTHNYLQNLEWCSRDYNVHYGTAQKRKAESCKKPIVCIELNCTFDGTVQAAQFIDRSTSIICKCLKGKKKTAGGYHWKYV